MVVKTDKIRFSTRKKDINFGSIYENAIAEELVSKGFDLYYYKNNRFGEIDFLIEDKGNVIPLEIKSGKNYKKHNALDNILSNDHSIQAGYILSNNNIEQDGKKTYLPIYMIMFFAKEETHDMLYQNNLSEL